MDWKPLLKNKTLLVIGLLGLALLFFGTIWRSGSTRVDNSGPSMLSRSQVSASATGDGVRGTGDSSNLLFQEEKEEDEQLEAILSQIAGIHGVHVMVALKSAETIQYAENQQITKSTTSQNGTSTTNSSTTNNQIFTARNSDGSEAPLVIARDEPRVSGVLVTVAANDFVIAQSEIISAIKNVLDVPAYKISVEPQKVG
ncbi:MAG: hypothetical protein OWS03_08795 [Alicyclobacillaceae bacterium]|nr:hypothetical protein [Alicyclobacillaceae bacterium]